MPNQNDWFIRERSEALASLLLTNRNDVAVLREDSRDGGTDLIVELKEGDKEPSTMLSAFAGTRRAAATCMQPVIGLGDLRIRKRFLAPLAPADFARTLTVPAPVSLVEVDLAMQLEQLSFSILNRQHPPDAAANSDA